MKTIKIQTTTSDLENIIENSSDLNIQIMVGEKNNHDIQPVVISGTEDDVVEVVERNWLYKCFSYVQNETEATTDFKEVVSFKNPQPAE